MPESKKLESLFQPDRFKVVLHRTDAGQVFTQVVWPETQNHELNHCDEIVEIINVTPRNSSEEEEFSDMVVALERLDGLTEGAISTIVGSVVQAVLDRVKLSEIK